MELFDLGLKLPSHLRIEVMSVNLALVFHAVVELRIKHFYSELFHQQDDVLIDRGDKGRHRDIEGN